MQRSAVLLGMIAVEGHVVRRMRLPHVTRIVGSRAVDAGLVGGALEGAREPRCIGGVQRGEVQEVEGALMIVPQRVIDEVTTFKTYDVRDLLTRRPDFAAPEMALKTGNPGQGFG